jgi:hypothetical protein
MAGPPEHIEPDDLWRQITTMPRPGRTVPFPRKNPETGEPVGDVHIWVLTQREQMECAAAAETCARERLKTAPKGSETSRGYIDIYENEASCQVLYRACRRAKNHNIPFFPSIEAVRGLLGDEVGVLVSSYLTIKSELGPIVDEMSEEEVDAWCRRLAEGGSRTPLDLHSLDALKTLAISLARRLYPFLTGTGSPGSPHESDTSQASPDQPSTTQGSAE